MDAQQKRPLNMRVNKCAFNQTGLENSAKVEQDERIMKRGGFQHGKN